LAVDIKVTDPLKMTDEELEAEAKKWIDPLCKHCYGRGYEALVLVQMDSSVGNRAIICRCVVKKKTKGLRENASSQT